MSEIDVVAAVIRRGGEVLLTRRPACTHLGGLWEFPGGKVESGESPERALVREIEEEIGVTIRTGTLFFEQQYTYPDRRVHLRFFLCEILKGTPEARGVADLVWAALADLERYEFPEANRPLVQKLQRMGG